jgi:hypothetical protein
VGTSSWREQFVEALKVTTDDDEEEEGGDGEKKEGEEGAAAAEGEDGADKQVAEKEPKTPSISDYLIHYVSLFWKLLFAFVPPTGTLKHFIKKKKFIRLKKIRIYYQTFGAAGPALSSRYSQSVFSRP